MKEGDIFDLSEEPHPSTREVFSKVRREDNCKMVMMGKSSSTMSSENSALNATTTETAAVVFNPRVDNTLS